MIGITKDKLLKKRLERITGIRINNNRNRFIKNNKTVFFLFTVYIILALTNVVLVYSFFRILNKL